MRSDARGLILASTLMFLYFTCPGQTPDIPAVAIKPKEIASADSTGARSGNASWWTKSEWWLVFVGAASCLAVAYQSYETRRSVRSASASIRLQEKSFAQWIDLVEWKATYDYDHQNAVGEADSVKAVNIEVAAVNPTMFPLVLRGASITFTLEDGRSVSFLFDYNCPISPNVPVFVRQALAITKEQSVEFFKGNLVIKINGSLGYTGVLDKYSNQPIYGTLTCGRGKADFKMGASDL